jgi:glycosyltransferase involved in cell wall biosynthesis
MSPEGGGPAEVVRRLAQTAHRNGVYETEIVSLDAPGASWLDGETASIHLLGPATGKYGYTSQLDRWLQKNLSRFDGVVVNGLWQYPGLAVWRARHLKIPYVVYPHGMLDPWFKRAYPVKHLKKLLYWSLIERRVLRDATAVMFTSRIEAELAPGTFPGSKWTTFTVPYGTVEPGGDSDRQVQRFYAKCPEVRAKPFLLFLGRIHKKKGCDLLVQSFIRLAARDAKIHLVIAGPDEEGWKTQLLSMASKAGLPDRVHFPGMLKGDEKCGAFYAAEAFVLPSHQENFGVAVAEALACGTPVLISNQVNIWRDIVEDEVGLVEDDNLEGTCRLLDRWRALPAEERMSMASKCRGSFKRRYDMNQVPSVIAGLFRPQAGESRPLEVSGPLYSRE